MYSLNFWPIFGNKALKPNKTDHCFDLSNSKSRQTIVQNIENNIKNLLTRKNFDIWILDETSPSFVDLNFSLFAWSRKMVVLLGTLVRFSKGEIKEFQKISKSLTDFDWNDVSLTALTSQ